MPSDQFYETFENGLKSEKELTDLVAKFGSSEILVEKPNLLKILGEEMLSPFYIFQYFSLWLWIYEEYINYSIAIIIITSTSIGVAVRDTYVNTMNIREMAQTKCEVTVKRCGKE
jgi:cation-transporting ATPase 13A3/4/5